MVRAGGPWGGIGDWAGGRDRGLGRGTGRPGDRETGPGAVDRGWGQGLVRRQGQAQATSRFPAVPLTAAASPQELEAMSRYTSPVNPAVFPHLTVVLLAIGMFFTAWFFVYPRGGSRGAGGRGVPSPSSASVTALTRGPAATR